MLPQRGILSAARRFWGGASFALQSFGLHLTARMIFCGRERIRKLGRNRFAGLISRLQPEENRGQAPRCASPKSRRRGHLQIGSDSGGNSSSSSVRLANPWSYAAENIRDSKRDAPG